MLFAFLILITIFALTIRAVPLNEVEQIRFDPSTFQLDCFNRYGFTVTVEIATASSSRQNLVTIKHRNRTIECTSPRCIPTQRIDEDDETLLTGYACANLLCRFDDDGQQCLPDHTNREGDALCEAVDQFSTAPRILCPQDQLNHSAELTECMVESGSMVGDFRYLWCQRKKL